MNCATRRLASFSDMSPLSGFPTDSSKHPSPTESSFVFSAAASKPLPVRRCPLTLPLTVLSNVSPHAEGHLSPAGLQCP